MSKPEATLQNEDAHYQTLLLLKDEQWNIKYLYDRLNIIDSKSSALLRFNGVIFGFLGLLVFRLVDKFDPLTQQSPFPYPFSMMLLCLFCFLFLAYAEFCCGIIFYLKFDRITDIKYLECYKKNFFNITIDRERWFRRALLSTYLGNFIFVGLFIAITVNELIALY
ncbi:hypothetical protein [Oleomonas cavernae]|uniref:hypothetical protein n=1 Tax=Oleomonas cavernae TaxID=2320859 RepID=UPI0011C43270|nr:hypothetical protein [Oleomonas cavernae]